MSLRRFAGYFLALSAAATVAFASCLMGQAALPETATRGGSMEAGGDGQISDRTALLFQHMQAHHLLSSAARTSRILASH